MAKNDINEDLVRRLADLLNETGLTEIEYGADNWRVRVAKQREVISVAASNQAAAPAASATPEPTGNEHANEPGTITSPMVGTVYLSPEPGAPTFVKRGDRVEAGQTILLVEAMKTFNEIRAPQAGEVAEILVNDHQPVEYGDALAIVR